MIEDGATMVAEKRLPDSGLSFVLCREMWSEYIIELGTVLVMIMMKMIFRDDVCVWRCNCMDV